MEATQLFNTRIVLYFFALLAFSIAVKDEPACSKFDFEEKLLEKQIRTDHKLELYEERIREMLNTFKNEKDSMTAAIETFTSDNNQMKENVADMEEKNKQMDEALTNMKEKNDRLTQDVVDREMRINKLFNTTLENAIADFQHAPDEADTAVVAFQARDITNRNPSVGESLIFQTVDLNQGDGYDPSTGVFTAPVRGIYIFSIQLATNPKKYIDVYIKKNGDVIGHFRTADSNWHITNTGFVVAYLDVGDAVSVTKQSDSSNSIYSGYWSSFSGTLVNPFNTK